MTLDRSRLPIVLMCGKFAGSSVLHKGDGNLKGRLLTYINKLINALYKSKLRWAGHVARMREKRNV
jgi:hypothetical protein